MFLLWGGGGGLLGLFLSSVIFLFIVSFCFYYILYKPCIFYASVLLLFIFFVSKFTFLSCFFYFSFTANICTFFLDI